jgi:hypothetical protein
LTSGWNVAGAGEYSVRCTNHGNVIVALLVHDNAMGTVIGWFLLIVSYPNLNRIRDDWTTLAGKLSDPVVGFIGCLFETA